MKKRAGFTLIEDSDQSMNWAFDCLWLKVQVPFYLSHVKEAICTHTHTKVLTETHIRPHCFE